MRKRNIEHKRGKGQSRRKIHLENLKKTQNKANGPKETMAELLKTRRGQKES